MDELERGFDTLLNLRLPHAETFPSSSDERRQIPPTPTILPLPSNDIRVRILESSDSHVASLQDKIRSIGEEISAYRDDPEGELLSLQAELEGLQEASIEAQLHQDLREEDWIRAEEQNEVIRNDLRTVENANTELVRRLDALSKEIDQVTRKKQYMEQSLATSSITIDPMNSNNREAVEDAVKRECTNLVTGFQARLAKELNTEETRLKDKRNRRAVLVAQLSRLQEERLELSNNLKLEKHVEGKLDYHDQNIHQRMQGLLDEARTQFRNFKLQCQTQLDSRSLKSASKAESLQTQLQNARERVRLLLKDQERRWEPSPVDPAITAMISDSVQRHSQNLAESLSQLRDEYRLDGSLEFTHPSPASSVSPRIRTTSPPSFAAELAQFPTHMMASPFAPAPLSNRNHDSLPNLASRQHMQLPLSNTPSDQSRRARHPPPPPTYASRDLHLPQFPARPITEESFRPGAMTKDVASATESPFLHPQDRFHPRDESPVIKVFPNRLSYSDNRTMGPEFSRAVEREPEPAPRHVGMNPGTRGAPRTPAVEAIRSGEFLVSRREQNRDQSLNPVKKAIRSLMQTLLGIRNDRGIGEAILKNGHCATLAEATEFAIADDPTQPTLTPFRPCWDDIKGSWNLALEDLFLAQFKTDYPEYSSDESYIRNHFRQRLETLRAAFFVQLRESNQPDLRDEAGSNRRRRERRRTLFRRRKGWTKDNAQSIKQSNGEETISLLCEMVELLGTDGMSSDESGSDSTKRCNVLHKNWRNPDVVRLLKWIDLHKPNHNVYGDRTGNPPHRRLRLPHGKAPESLRRAIANLPINFYNPIWYEGLSAGQKIRLGATVAQPLPLYILTWPRTGLASDPDDLDDY